MKKCAPLYIEALGLGKITTKNLSAGEGLQKRHESSRPSPRCHCAGCSTLFSFGKVGKNIMFAISKVQKIILRIQLLVNNDNLITPVKTCLPLRVERLTCKVDELKFKRSIP